MLEHLTISKKQMSGSKEMDEVESGKVSLIREYLDRVSKAFDDDCERNILKAIDKIEEVWLRSGSIYLVGNGGSGGNAIHIANDWLYGTAVGENVNGIRVEALTSNSAVVTCLANDTGYENIFAGQMRVKGDPGDILLCLSGSGNSANIINALHAAKDIGMTTISFLAFGGGKAYALSDIAVLFQTCDMQVAEDSQLIAGHLCMQVLKRRRDTPREDERLTEEG